VPPLPGPGQDAENSYYNTKNPSHHMTRTLNVYCEREAPPRAISAPSFDSIINETIGAIDISCNDNNDLKEAA
jgi:hypothetical protein